MQLLYRYIYVKVSTQVTPNRLLDSGRITAKSVFIITNVDNRHHINIVLDFNKYLKSHCAVGEVYFALDPKTGITSQSEHDPWKWAQGRNSIEIKWVEFWLENELDIPFYILICLDDKFRNLS